MKFFRMILLMCVAVAAMTAEAAETKESQAAECRAARKLSAEICAKPEECTIKTEAQYEKTVQLLKEAPLTGDSLNKAEIKALFTQIPTKETINNLIAKLQGPCETSTYYKLASAVGKYQLQVNAPKKLKETKEAVKDWVQKDLKADYPTMDSLSTKASVVSQYVTTNVVKVSDEAKKEWKELDAEIQKTREQHSADAAEGTSSSKWDPKTWQGKIKEEVEVTKKLAQRMSKWVEDNWK